MKLRFKLFILTLLSILVLSGTTTFAAVPAANAQIGNQATLEYINDAGVRRTLVSNIVLTKVNAFYGIWIDGTKTGSSVTVEGEAGRTVYLRHTITNISNITETFNLTIENNSDESSVTNITFIEGNTVTLMAGETREILIAATIDNNAALTDKTVIFDFVTTSETSSTTTVRVTDTVKIFENISIVYISNQVDQTEGSKDIVVIYNVSNEGTKQSTTTAITVDFSNVVYEKKTFSLLQKESIEVTYIDTFDVEQTVFFSYEEIVNKTTKKDVYISYENEVLVIKPKYIKQTTTEAATIKYHMTCNETRSGNYYASYSYTYYNGREQVNISEHNTTTSYYTIAKLFAVDIVGDEIYDAEQGSTIAFKNVVTNTGNTADVFDITLSDNLLPGGTEIYLAYGDEATTAPYAETTPLIDTDGSGIVDTGILEPGESKVVLLYAKLPIEAKGSGYKIKNRATSMEAKKESMTTYDEAYDLLTIVAVEVDITSNYYLGDSTIGNRRIGQGKGPESSPVEEKSIDPGNVAYFLLYVNNTSSQLTDEYVLDYAYDASFTKTVQSGLTVKIQSVEGADIHTTGSIAPQGYKPIRVIVTSENLTSANNFSLYIRAKSSLTNAYDVITTMVTVVEKRDLAIMPELKAETYPSSIVVYTHSIVNRGNVIEGDHDHSRVLLSTKDSDENFTSLIYWDKNDNGILDKSSDPQLIDLSIPELGGLAPGESIRVFNEVLVGIKADAAKPANQTLITMDVTSELYSEHVLKVTLVDTTTIIADTLLVEKEQAVSDDDYEEFLIDSKYDSREIRGNLGDYIYYKIAVTNTGDKAVTDVLIEDVTPEYTTMSGSCTLFVDGIRRDNYILYEPTEGARGLVEASIPYLGAGDTATLYFKVKINE